MSASEAFSKYYLLCSPTSTPEQDELFKKMERVLSITIWEVNMNYYKTILESLVRVGRRPEKLLSQIEGHVLSNLSMDYTVQTMVDILFAFSTLAFGSNQLYNALSVTITQGHLFNKNFFTQKLHQLPYSGRLLAKLVDAYAKVMARDSSFQLDPNFKQKLYRLLLNKKTLYAMPDIL